VIFGFIDLALFAVAGMGGMDSEPTI
jgi:hypothetical protein